MGSTCLECGIAAGENGALKCYKYNLSVEDTVKMNTEGCHYFIRRIYEDGEPLAPQQHILIIEQEISSRHMKGPV